MNSPLALMLLALLPIVAVAAALCWGFRPWPLSWALLRRYAGVNTIFVLLIATSIGMGVAVTAVERALREGSARAAEKFELVVGAPGSELTLLFASVFLEPSVIPLLDGAQYTDVAESPGVRFAAPLGFGDSFEGAPIVGTTQDLVTHMAGDAPAEGRFWADPFEAVIGHHSPLALGDVFEPAHGVGDNAQDGVHGDLLTVVGRLPPTGAPWDHAIIVPIESVWLTHGLAPGHAPGNDWLGAPFDAAYFPGTPVIVVSPESLPAAYGLRGALDGRTDMTAIFPGTELSNLYVLMGDLRAAMAVMGSVTQFIVAVSVLTALIVLTRLFSRQIRLLSVLGAPQRFTLAVIWSYGAALLAAGTVLGVFLGLSAAGTLGRMATAQTNMAITARLGGAELVMAAGFLCGATLCALFAAAFAVRQSQSARE